MKRIVFSLGLILLSCEATHTQNAQKKIVGGGCEGCELLFEGMPMALSWQTTLTAKDEPGEVITIKGTIYQKDGRTPAPHVILYIYHTDNNGLYSPSKNQTAGKRHGHLRGWMETDSQGRYQFHTIRPKPYPNAKIPEHIHPTIKEQDKNEYYIDEFQFEDDPYLTKEIKSKEEKRGGSGIIRLMKNDEGEWMGTRNIILGFNIPNY
jgi:protocatechuate 3,4-dioxygenase, beta subunit